MSDNDLIRRGAVIATLTNLPIFSEHLSDAENSRAVSMIYKAQREVAAIEPAPVTPAEVVKEPRIIPFHTASGFGVCIGGRWDGWMMIQHPDGYWVSHHKPEPVHPSIVALRAISAMKEVSGEA